MRFDTMSMADFSSPLASTVSGSWNLCKALSKHRLSFFIFLFSVSGVCGTHGQANYAAGNTYQDALAGYLVSLGEPAASVALGKFESIGH